MELFGDQALSCPKCASPTLLAGQPCQDCGLALTGVRLYDPKYFVWLAVLFSGMVPVFMAGTNWGRIGKTRTKWLCFGSGILVFGVLFALVFHGANDPPRPALALNLLVNLPFGILLRDQQRSLFADALRLGAQRASPIKGLGAGVLIVICEGALVGGGISAFSEDEFRTGLNLMDERKYEQAMGRFEHVLKQNPNADGARFNIALCHLFLEHWDEGAKGFEKYLRRDNKKAAAFAFLAYIRYRQGRQAEGDALVSRALALDPKIMEKLFGSDQPRPGPPRPV